MPYVWACPSEVRMSRACLGAVVRTDAMVPHIGVTAVDVVQRLLCRLVAGARVNLVDEHHGQVPLHEIGLLGVELNRYTKLE